MPTAQSRKPLKRKPDDTDVEQRLLAEFLRSRSVAALAGAIARRLGGGLSAVGLLAEAGLAPAPVLVRTRWRG